MPATGLTEKNITKAVRSRIEAVSETLEHYAQRGVFRGFTRGPVVNQKASFRIVWHRDRVFDFIFDFHRNTMRFPLVLPAVPPDSRMYLELKAFIQSRHSDELPDHRRIDSRKAQIKPSNRGGNVGLTLRVRNGDCQYGTRKLIHLVHEIFMTFLLDGNYYEYMVETFNLDPDSVISR